MKHLPERLRIQVVILTFGRWISNINSRMIYPFLSVFARGMGVDLAAISLVLTARSLVAALIPFANSAIDTRGRKTSLLLGVGLFTVGISVSVFWHGYTAFFITQCVAYFGAFLYASSSQAFYGDRVPYEQRGSVMAITETSWALSFIIAMPIVGVLIGWFGWTVPFPALVVLGIFAFVLIARFVERDSAVTAVQANLFSGLSRVFSSPRALTALSVSFILVTANEVVNVVFGVWMESSFGLQLAALGAASAVIGVSELSGELLSAGLADRLGKKRAIMGGMAMMAVASIILPWVGRLGVGGALLGLFLFYLTFEFTIVCSLPFMTEIMPEARATFMGANVAFISLGRALGAFIAPLLFAIGFLANTLASLALLVLAFIMLSRVSVVEKKGVPEIANT
jgi:predicted MFS family arabinose efflux permease